MNYSLVLGTNENWRVVQPNDWNHLEKQMQITTRVFQLPFIQDVLSYQIWVTDSFISTDYD